MASGRPVIYLTAGEVIRGSDAFFPDVAGLREGAAELLHENGIDDPLPDDAMVF